MPQEFIPHRHASSSRFAANERFDRWRAGQGGYCTESLPEGLHADQFHFEVSFSRFSNFLLSQAKCGPRHQQRTARNIRNDQLDHYRIELLNEGIVHCDADGAAREVRPGQFIVTDMSRPNVYKSSAAATIAMFIPREVLDEALPRACDLHGFVLEGRASQLLATHMRGLAAAASQMQTQQMRLVSDATVSLAAVALSPSARTLDHARPVIESTLLRQACRYIDLHVKEPRLSVHQLSAFFKVSRSSFYRLFMPLGGVQNFIIERRLAHAHEALASASAKVHLATVSARFGFSSPTVFSRQFRHRYGYSPGDAPQHRRGMENLGDSGLNSDPKAFGLWLQSLRD